MKIFIPMFIGFIVLSAAIIYLNVRIVDYQNIISVKTAENEKLKFDAKMIPTVMEVQTKLQLLGYYQGEIDGIIGPKMKDGWKRAVNDAMAVQHFPVVQGNSTNMVQ